MVTTEGEPTERPARVISAAEDVLDDAEDAREWLTKPHPELEGRPPLQTAETGLGARRAQWVLDAIFYGLPV
jgi:putative toxin-antitoxin system antitoxin component (TIGR02293 family)